MAAAQPTRRTQSRGTPKKGSDASRGAMRVTRSRLLWRPDPEEAHSITAAALNAYFKGDGNVFSDAIRLAGAIALVDLAESPRAISGRTA